MSSTPRHVVPDLDSLALLLEIGQEGSLGRAAARHGLSQPAVTARLRSMERLVGVTLVERGPTGSRLTPAGALVADWARGVLDAADVLAAGISSLRQDIGSRLRVAASLTIAEHLLPVWLVRFAEHRPTTTISLDAMNSVHVEAAVLAGSVDLGFVEGPRIPQGLSSQVVGHDRLAVVVPPTHPWARRRTPLTAEELASTRLVQREPTSGTRAALESALAPLTTAPPVLELSTTSAVRSAAAAGAAPAVLSVLAVREDIAAGRLVEVQVPGLDLSRRLRAVWPRGARPSAPGQDLLRVAHDDRSLLRGTRPSSRGD
ncbi:LysR family transcriptional regulator [Actinotalea sp.]|uniref:LysR family transcriptional regulator n=1 Tax=Actinotalea sp. TaxID=1872145 RepID=UPI0035628AA8